MPSRTFCFHLIIQDSFDELLVTPQTVGLGPVDLSKVVLVQVQLWSTVHDVSDDSGQSRPLLGSCCMLVRLTVTVQELEDTKEETAL